MLRDDQRHDAVLARVGDVEPAAGRGSEGDARRRAERLASLVAEVADDAVGPDRADAAVVVVGDEDRDLAARLVHDRDARRARASRAAVAGPSSPLWPQTPLPATVVMTLRLRVDPADPVVVHVGDVEVAVSDRAPRRSACSGARWSPARRRRRSADRPACRRRRRCGSGRSWRRSSGRGSSACRRCRCRRWAPRRRRSGVFSAASVAGLSSPS